jgi:hypothetical protein
MREPPVVSMQVFFATRARVRELIEALEHVERNSHYQYGEQRLDAHIAYHRSEFGNSPHRCSGCVARDAIARLEDDADWKAKLDQAQKDIEAAVPSQRTDAS